MLVPVVTMDTLSTKEPALLLQLHLPVQILTQMPIPIVSTTQDPCAPAVPKVSTLHKTELASNSTPYARPATHQEPAPAAIKATLFQELLVQLRLSSIFPSAKML
jgi:hypothetical protein